MAKITFGPIVSEARNKVGGVVYSRNTYGPYSRAFIVPPYTNTSAQAAARAALTALSQRWGSTLTDEQRAGWRSLGELYPHTDVFHQVNARPGLQAYLRANLALASVGSSPVDTAPQNWHATDPGEITATAVSGSPPAITVNCDSAPAINEAVQIWVSPQLSTGQTYFYKYMRLVATFSAGTAGPWDPSTGWSTRFSSLAFPSKLGLGVRYVNVETGATGPMRTALITATEGDSDAMKTATVVLNDTQLHAIFAAPIQLVPAPAPGKYYDLLGYSFVLQGTTDYDPGPILIFQIGTTGLYAGDTIASAAGYLPVPAIRTGAVIGGVGNAGQFGWNDSASLVAQPINITGLTGPLTGGDPGNTLRCTVYYLENDF